MVSACEGGSGAGLTDSLCASEARSVRAWLGCRSDGTGATRRTRGLTGEVDEGHVLYALDEDLYPGRALSGPAPVAVEHLGLEVVTARAHNAVDLGLGLAHLQGGGDGVDGLQGELREGIDGEDAAKADAGALGEGGLVLEVDGDWPGLFCLVEPGDGGAGMGGVLQRGRGGAYPVGRPSYSRRTWSSWRTRVGVERHFGWRALASRKGPKGVSVRRARTWRALIAGRVPDSTTRSTRGYYCSGILSVSCRRLRGHRRTTLAGAQPPIPVVLPLTPSVSSPSTHFNLLAFHFNSLTLSPSSPRSPPAMGDAHISVVAGIIVGLLASCVQSLGLTIQRKSHVLNQALPDGQQRVEHRRPCVPFCSLPPHTPSHPRCCLPVAGYGSSVSVRALLLHFPSCPSHLIHPTQPFSYPQTCSALSSRSHRSPSSSSLR